MQSLAFCQAQNPDPDSAIVQAASRCTSEQEDFLLKRARVTMPTPLKLEHGTHYQLGGAEEGIAHSRQQHTVFECKSTLCIANLCLLGILLLSLVSSLIGNMC